MCLYSNISASPSLLVTVLYFRGIWTPKIPIENNSNL